MEEEYSCKIASLVQAANDQLHAILFHASAFLNCTAAFTTVPEADPLSPLDASLALTAEDAPEVIRFAFTAPHSRNTVEVSEEQQAAHTALQGLGVEAAAHRAAYASANDALVITLRKMEALLAGDVSELSAPVAAAAAERTQALAASGVVRAPHMSDVDYIEYLTELKHAKLERIREQNDVIRSVLSRCATLRAKIVAALAVPQPPPAPLPLILAPAPAAAAAAVAAGTAAAP